MGKVRLAIVGAGIQGTNHARVAAGLRDGEVAVVVDPDEDRAAMLGQALGVPYTADLSSVLGDVDAAVVAVPPELHRAVGLRCMEAGVVVLVEKPLAATVEDAQALVQGAEAHGVLLMAGHVERFNPAVLALDGLADGVVHINALRISSFSPRVGLSVVLDLMIHDLDIVLALARSEVRRVLAITQVVRSSSSDIGCALLEFENGITANLTASRAGQQKIRQLSLTRSDGYIVADLVRQDVRITRVDHAEFLSSGGATFRETGMVEIPYLEHRGEPLFLELSHFVGCVLSGTPPKVSGGDGLRALELALAIDRQLAGG